MKVLSILILCVLMFSCKPKDTEVAVKKESDTIIVYDVNTYIKLHGYAKEKGKTLVAVDTACLTQKKRAARDIAKGKYIFYMGMGIGTSEAEMEHVKKTFLKKGIIIDYMLSSCIPTPGGFSDNCYEQAMNETIADKYGRSLVDSIYLTEMEFRRNN
ncbi:hypothetical protein OGH69_02295 [Flavobacterium sp. MFBS3-15]|uniref:hypothetical protein n=1 Tax=Flavobacterium sp. MFBS3-15 TaxID=2989816 RepID=UPI0022358744|nr:hypothetical protein [Flavobacterium sp. MFBS3-15]MCW4467780.1 hypothetical protein [Flavobacterium sp. MFBS3-15]